MNKKRWMIFRTEVGFVYYIYNGDFPVLIHLPPDTNPNPYYWTGIPATDMSEKETDQLNIVMSGRQRVFELTTRPKQRYVVVQRGEFVEE